MASIKLLQHGVKYNENERLIYFSPILLNSSEDTITSVYNDEGIEEIASVAITESLIGSSKYRRFISEESKTITSIDFDYGEDTELSVVVDNATNLVKGDVLYFNITGGDVDEANYALNESAFIISNIISSTVYLKLHYDIPTDVVDTYSTGTSMVGNLCKPYYNFPMSNSDLMEMSLANTVDLQISLEFYIKQITDNTNSYNGVIVYSSEIVGSNLDLTPEESIYEFTENGYLYKNGVSVQSAINRLGILKPAMIVRFDDYTFENGQRINIDSAISDDDLLIPNQSVYDGYIDNIARVAEDLVNKGLGDIWHSIVGIDLQRSVYERETVDYIRVENYIDQVLAEQNATNTFSEIYVTDKINIGDMSIFSDESGIFFESENGTFGIKIDNQSFGYDRIIFDNDAIVQFNDNVEANNTFEIKYSSAIEDGTRQNTLVESRMGFLKVKLSNNTSDSISDNKIKYFYTIGSQEEIDDRILFSSYIWQNNDISSLGYFSHRNINNLSTFNNFISSKMTAVTVSQNLERVGIVSQDETYIYSKNDTYMLSQKLEIRATNEIVINSKKVTYNVDELGFSINTFKINNISAKTIDVTTKVSSNNIDVSSLLKTLDTSTVQIEGLLKLGNLSTVEGADYEVWVDTAADNVLKIKLP